MLQAIWIVNFAENSVFLGYICMLDLKLEVNVFAAMFLLVGRSCRMIVIATCLVLAIRVSRKSSLLLVVVLGRVY